MLGLKSKTIVKQLFKFLEMLHFTTSCWRCCCSTSNVSVTKKIFFLYRSKIDYYDDKHRVLKLFLIYKRFIAEFSILFKQCRVIFIV